MKTLHDSVPSQRSFVKSTAFARKAAGSAPVPGSATSCRTLHQCSLSSSACRVRDLNKNMTVAASPGRKIFPLARPKPWQSLFFGRLLAVFLPVFGLMTSASPAASERPEDTTASLFSPCSARRVRTQGVVVLRRLHSAGGPQVCLRASARGATVSSLRTMVVRHACNVCLKALKESKGPFMTRATDTLWEVWLSPDQAAHVLRPSDMWCRAP